MTRGGLLASGGPACLIPEMLTIPRKCGKILIPWQVETRVFVSLDQKLHCFTNQQLVVKDLPIIGVSRATCQGVQKLDGMEVFDSMATSYELNVVHPATAKWLAANGYDYQHEVKMPETGRADFVATKAGCPPLIIECKSNPTAKSGRSIIQLLDYGRQMPGSDLAYAAAAIAITPKISAMCEGYGIQIIALDIPVYEKDGTSKGAVVNPNWLAFSGRCVNQPLDVIKEILVFHNKWETNPFVDLFLARSRGISFLLWLDGSAEDVSRLKKVYDHVIFEWLAKDEYEHIADVLGAMFDTSPSLYVISEIMG